MDSASSSNRSRSRSIAHRRCRLGSRCPSRASLHREGSRLRDLSESYCRSRSNISDRQPKKMNQGPVTRNPFLNFFREFRSRNCNKNVIDLARLAGIVWRKMDTTQREPYKRMAAKAPKTIVRRRRVCSRCGKRSVSVRRSATRSKSRKSCKSRSRKSRSHR